MNNGWVKLHRKLLANIELMNDDMALWLFIVLLLKANPKGQVLISTRKLASEYKKGHTTIFRALQRLTKYGITQQLTQHRKTKVSICNWQKYQGVDPRTQRQKGGYGHLTQRPTQRHITDKKHYVTQRPTQLSRNSDATVTQRPPLNVRIENKNKEGEVINLEGEGYKKAQAIRDGLAARLKV